MPCKERRQHAVRGDLIRRGCVSSFLFSFTREVEEMGTKGGGL